VDTPSPPPPDRRRTGWWRWALTCALAGVAGSATSFAGYFTVTAEGMEALGIPVFLVLSAVTLGLWALAQWRLVPFRHPLVLAPLLTALVAGAVTLAPEIAEDIRRDHERHLRAERVERERTLEERAAADDRERQQQRRLADTGDELRDGLTRLWRLHRDDTGVAVDPWALDPPAGHDTPLAVQALAQLDHGVPVALFDTDGDGVVDRVQVGAPPDVRCLTASTYDHEPGGLPHLGGPMLDAACDGEPVVSAG
jgi:hypothetical protein